MKQKDFIMNTADLKDGQLIDVVLTDGSKYEKVNFIKSTTVSLAFFRNNLIEHYSFLRIKSIRKIK